MGIKSINESITKALRRLEKEATRGRDEEDGDATSARFLTSLQRISV